MSSWMAFRMACISRFRLSRTWRSSVSAVSSGARRLVVEHSVGRRYVHQSVAHEEDAGLVQFADVLRALVAVARVLGLVHQNGVSAHTFNSRCCLPWRSCRRSLKL